MVYFFNHREYIKKNHEIIKVKYMNKLKRKKEKKETDLEK